jgi:tetratricopeptide (TPR) repeat protein
MLRQSLEMNRRELGADHPNVAANAASLAYWLIDAGAYAEAGQLLEESLAIRHKVLGENHPQVASTLTVKANLLLATRHYEAARQAASEARRILSLSLPKEHWQVAMAMNVEGAALAGLGDYQNAEPLLLGSLERLSGSPIPNLDQVGRERLAKLYTAWGRPEQASKYN